MKTTCDSCSLERRSALAMLLSLPMWRAALAQQAGGAGGSTYRALRSPVAVAAPRAPWETRAFKAWLDPRADDGLSFKELLLGGVLLRLPGASGSGLRAFCVLCPHEICVTEYVDDGRPLPVEQAPAPAHPLFFCVCHSSVFDPARDGRRIGGPAPRGLYRFALEARADSVRVTGIEEALLKRLGEVQ